MDFYDEVAHKLIGLEIKLSQKYKENNLPVGYTTGKARIHRHVLKKYYGIHTDLQLESLKDALSELGYALVQFDYASDLFLINQKNFLINTRIIDSGEIEEFKSAVLVDTAKKFLEARKLQSDTLEATCEK